MSAHQFADAWLVSWMVVLAILATAAPVIWCRFAILGRDWRGALLALVMTGWAGVAWATVVRLCKTFYGAA